jgi:putative flippase GtrA
MKKLCIRGDIMRFKKEILMYILFGILTTIINIAVYAFFVEIINVNYKISTTIAWLVSLLFAYITNKIYVFHSKQTNLLSILKEMISFIFFRMATYFLDIGSMIVMIELFHFNEHMAKIASNILIVISNYLVSKFFVFKPNKNN